MEPLDRSNMAKTVNKSSKNPKKTAAVADLFASMEKPQRAAAKSRGSNASSAGEAGYTATHIEVLEGLEPVRRRPARRRRLGCQRPVRPHGGRGRARPEAL